MFQDRRDAGRRLAAALVGYKRKPVVVYALPRGGVVVAAEVAQFLNAPLDLIVVRKIGHPLSPEYAVGAVDEDGHILVNPVETETLDPEWLKDQATAEWNEAKRRRRVYLGEHPPVSVSGKIAILVDDGLATGLTMKAAIRQARKRQPGKIIVAVPLAAEEAAKEIRSEVDELIVLLTPEKSFPSIGYYYQNFDQVTDEEVVTLMTSLRNDQEHILR